MAVSQEQVSPGFAAMQRYLEQKDAKLIEKKSAYAWLLLLGSLVLTLGMGYCVHDVKVICAFATLYLILFSLCFLDYQAYAQNAQTLFLQDQWLGSKKHYENIQRYALFMISLLSTGAEAIYKLDENFINHIIKNGYSDLVLSNLGNDIIPLIAPLIAPFFGVIAAAKKHTLDDPQLTGGLSVFFSSFAFVTSFYALLCGVWGLNEFKAAADLFNISFSDPWPLSLHRVTLANLLYTSQGGFWFYLLWGALPFIGFLREFSQWFKNWFDIGEFKKSKAMIVYAYLAFLTCDIANNVGDIAYAKYKILKLGTPLDSRWVDHDTALKNCLKQAGGEIPKKQACFVSSLAIWKQEEQTMSQEILSQASAKGRQQFPEYEKAFIQKQYEDLEKMRKSLQGKQNIAAALIHARAITLRAHMYDMRDIALRRHFSVQ